VVPIKSDSEHFVPEGKTAGLPQPQRGKRMGAIDEGIAAQATATSTCYGMPWLSILWMSAGFIWNQRWAGLRLGGCWRQLVCDCSGLPGVLSVEVQTLG